MTQSLIRLLVILFWCGVVAWWFLARPEPVTAQTTSAGTTQDGTALFWFKGNTHAHAAIELNGWSHGDSEPDTVIGWYRDHGYHFVAVTDHNRWHDGNFRAVADDSQEDFLLLSGMEITSDHRYPGVMETGERKVHSTALGIDRQLDWLFEDPDIASIVQQHATAARSAGGLAILNHPNYRFQVQPRDIIAAPDVGLIEIFNDHPRANQQGHAGFRLPTEALWDEVLSAGRQVWGVAADDAHHFGWYGQLMRRFGAAPPGGGWIMVRAPDLGRESIIDAMRAGEFYASTGVQLREVSMRGDTLHIVVNTELTKIETQSPWVKASAPLLSSDDSHLVIEFIGAHGKLLHWTHDQDEVTFRLPPGEPYVRARVTLLKKTFSVVGADRARAFYAWTQPLFVDTGSTH